MCVDGEGPTALDRQSRGGRLGLGLGLGWAIESGWHWFTVGSFSLLGFASYPLGGRVFVCTDRPCLIDSPCFLLPWLNSNFSSPPSLFSFWLFIFIFIFFEIFLFLKKFCRLQFCCINDRSLAAWRPFSFFGYFGQCGDVWGSNQYLPITVTGGKEIESGVRTKRKRRSELDRNETKADSETKRSSCSRIRITTITTTKIKSSFSNFGSF